MTDQPVAPPVIDFKFSGKGGEYFKIWIVNILLSIVTLGIYSAWAKVRTNRYFYGNTTLEGSAFEYHATPMMILKGRIIAFTLLILYILLSNFFPIAGIVLAVIVALISPWAIWKSMQFNARMISYRNVRFSFHGSMKESYKIFLLIPLLPLIVAGILGLIAYAVLGSEASGWIGGLVIVGIFSVYFMVPYIQKLVTSFYINEHRYGQGEFSAQLQGSKYYKIYLAAIGWSLLGSLVLSFVAGIIMLIAGLLFGGADMLKGMDPENINPEAMMATMLPIMILSYIPFIGLMLWFKAYMEANVRNYVFESTELDDVLQLKSSIKTGKLFGIYLLNTLLVIVTLGLAYPWTIIRLTKYKVETTAAEIKGNMAQYVNQQQESQSALGEELGDAFDLDMGLGL